MYPHYNHKRMEQVKKELTELDDEFADAYKKNEIPRAVKAGIRYNKIYPEWLNQKDAKELFLHP